MVLWWSALTSLCIAADVPKGHLQPFGGWQEGSPVEERTDMPEPHEFYNEYCTSDEGSGRPVIFRGAAFRMASAKWGTDQELLKHFGKEKVTGVEYDLKETRAGGQVDGMNTLGKFLNAYNSSDIYMVSEVPKRMRKDVDFLPCMRCGGYLDFLDVANMWMGRGGSKSVIHYDEQDNVNCMIAGKKKFVFIHPRHKEQFEANPNTNKNKFGWVDTELDRSVPGYGAYFKIDVDKMDLVKYPGWRDVQWSYANLEAGDCLYIPYQWYHQVTAEPARSINVHMWYWRPAKFDAKSCEKLNPNFAPSLGDCTWGYEPPRGNLGRRVKGTKPTKCKQPSPRSEL